jgi:hypothetical protein
MSWIGRSTRGFHLYAIYELFGIPSHRWFSCLPLQSTANHAEQLEIGRYVATRRSR